VVKVVRKFLHIHLHFRRLGIFVESIHRFDHRSEPLNHLLVRQPPKWIKEAHSLVIDPIFGRIHHMIVILPNEHIQNLHTPHRVRHYKARGRLLVLSIQDLSMVCYSVICDLVN